MLLIQGMHDSVLYTTYLHWKVLPEKLIIAYLEIPHLLYNPKPDHFTLEDNTLTKNKLNLPTVWKLSNSTLRYKPTLTHWTQNLKDMKCVCIWLRGLNIFCPEAMLKYKPRSYFFLHTTAVRFTSVHPSLGVQNRLIISSEGC
jgi:hypothetical protein